MFAAKDTSSQRLSESEVPPKPAMPAINPDGIPAALKDRAQWIAWRWDWSAEHAKWEKPPREVRTQRLASSTDPATWSTYFDALGFVDLNHDYGIGFVFTADDPLCGADLDHCRDPETGAIALWARELLAPFRTYMEVSPSATGIHIIGCATIGAGHNKAYADGKVEVYDRGRYFTVTGDHLETTPADVADAQAAADALIETVFSPVPAMTVAANGTTPSPALTDDEIIALGMAERTPKFAHLFRDGDTSFYRGDDSAADFALCRKVSFYTQDAAQIERVMRRSALVREKWDERRGETTWLGDTIAKALALVTERYTAPDQVRQDAQIDDGLTRADFVSYLPERKYICTANGKIWEPAGIDRAFPPIGDGPDAIKQSTIIDRERPVHDLTWAPGLPQIIEDRLLDQGGWIEKKGARVYNHYRAPVLADGDHTKADPWLDHLALLYPEDAPHIVDWLAHRVQFPGDKLNHALVLGGKQGIGKDSIVEPVLDVVGRSNAGDVSPVELLARFNTFLRAVILRVSELRDLGDRDRFGFYEHTKTMIAAPPETIRIDEKNLRAYLVPNLVGIVFTTNHQSDGLYLPADDRRHYVAWSEKEPTDFPKGYFEGLYQWFADDGDGVPGSAHVGAYLRAVDLDHFDPKAPPPKTTAFWDVVASARTREDNELADALDLLGDPDAVTIGDIVHARGVDLDFQAWLGDRRHSRQIRYRFEACGYLAISNPDDKSDGQWRVNGKRQVIYAKRSLTQRERLDKAQERKDRTGWLPDVPRTEG